MKNILRTFADKEQAPVKFIVVGIWNTIFGYIVFVVLDTLFSYIFRPRYLAYMSAMTVGTLIAIVNAFIFHKYITFKSKVRNWEIISEFFRFCVTYTASFLLSLILMPIFVEALGLSPKIAAAVIIPICAWISYIGHSKFSFQ